MNLVSAIDSKHENCCLFITSFEWRCNVERKHVYGNTLSHSSHSRVRLAYLDLHEWCLSRECFNFWKIEL